MVLVIVVASILPEISILPVWLLDSTDCVHMSVNFIEFCHCTQLFGCGDHNIACIIRVVRCPEMSTINILVDLHFVQLISTVAFFFCFGRRDFGSC